MSTGEVHCDSGSYEAYFGGGTKLTVLGKKSKQVFFKICSLSVSVQFKFNSEVFCFNPGTKPTVLSKFVKSNRVVSVVYNWLQMLFLKESFIY